MATTAPRDVEKLTLSETPETIYLEAAEKLRGIEKELGVLLRKARSVRGQRGKMALECLTSSEVDESAAEEARFLQKYLELTATAKGVGDVIKTLAVERAASRAHCEVLLWKIPNGPKRRELRKELDRRQISSIVEEYDKEVMLTDFEEALETAVKAGGIVGAFGAGIAYTTIFTAARGRLDLISGAFTCFLVVVIVCTGMRAIALPTLYAGHLRNGPRSMKKTVMVHLVLYAAPLLAGFILLGVSVGTIDGLSRTPVLPGSRAAMQVSGYLPVAILGYFVVSLILVSMVKCSRRSSE